MAASPVTVHDETASTTPLHSAAPARRSGWSLFMAGMGFAALLLLVGFLTLWRFGSWEANFVDADAKRVEFRKKTLADRQTDDEKLLHGAPSWLAKDKGTVRVPIDQAIALTMPKLQSDKPHPAYPLTQSPPQPAAAPTSPDKGGGTSAPGNNAVNPPASNPTVGQPSPAPAATNTPAPTPAAPANPTAAILAPATPTPAPAATPVSSVPAPANNNANNPGTAPIPGTNAQPPAPTPDVAAPTASPNSGATAAPLATPPAQPTPTGTAPAGATTPSPAITESGASPAGTP